MPAEANANIDKSFLPPPPIEKVVGPDIVEGGPQPGSDWTTSGAQSERQIADGARGFRQVVSRETQAIRRAAGMTPEEAARA